MTYFTFFQGSSEQVVQPNNESVEISIDSQNRQGFGFARKIIKLKYEDAFLLLNNEDVLYKGQLHEQVHGGELPIKTIKFSELKTEISDFAQDLNLDIIYFLRNGIVYQGSSKSLTCNDDNDAWEQIKIDVKIDQIECNNLGVFFISCNLELYGLGNFGDVHKSDVPTCFECFRSFKVLKLACGDNFVVVLTQQAQKYLEKLPGDAKCDEFLQYGDSTLSTCVWSFGNVNKGHLGTGDHIKRTGINVVLGLQNKNVIDIACGIEHSIALTLTGHLYVWGNNSKQQIVSEKLECISMPKLSSERILAASCGLDNVITLSDTLNIRNQKSAQSNTIPAIDYLNNSNEGSLLSNNVSRIPLVLALDKNLILINNVQLNRKLLKHYNEEQMFLEKQLYIDSMLRLHKRSLQLDSFDEFYNRHEKLLFLTTSNLKSLRAYFFTSHNDDIYLATQYYEHYHTVLIEYVNKFCDNFAMELFTKSNVDQIAQIAEDIKGIPSHTERYVDILRTLALPTEEFERCKATWADFRQIANEQMLQASNTCLFWKMHSSEKLLPLKEPHRRFLLSSLDVPLKSSQNNLFSSNLFILFNDYLVLVQTTLIKYPLKLLWLSAIAKKNAFEIITPEDLLMVRASTHKDVQLWFETLEKACDLLMTNDVKSRGYRNTDYDFSARHPKYANSKYCGEWLNGKLHGIGFLILPTPSSASNQQGIFDGKIYNGQFLDNLIQGYGNLDEFVLDDKVSSYCGDFEDGKFCGYGEIQNFKTGETYRGFFKNNCYHGYGELATTTYTYVGEFLNNNKSGYGVLDDRVSGQKFMGMFLLNKKNGSGFLMTQTGDYFEGIFVNDILSEHGMAIFQNGSYFRGDLTLYGPKGRGTFYFSGREIVNEQEMQLDDQPIVIGNILTGILGGTWDNVKIENGNLLLNETYPMMPSISTSLVVQGPIKWFSIFHCWLLYVFGSSDLYKLKNKKLWIRIANFMISMKNKKELRENNFEQLTISIKDSITEDPPTPLRNGSTLAALQYLRASISDSKINILNRSFSDFKTTSLSNSSEDVKEYESAPTMASRGTLAQTSTQALDTAQFIPKFGIEGEFTAESWRLLKDYLVESFNNDDHPLGYLANFLINSFSIAYINWKAKPVTLLADIAVKEFESIIERIFYILKVLFPALPETSTFVDGDLFTQKSLLYPIFLKDSVHSILFMLYANKCSHRDEIYRQRLQLFEKKTTEEITEFINVDANLTQLIKHENFASIVEDFKKFKEKFCPFEMLKQIEQSFQKIEQTKVVVLGEKYALCADDLITLTIILVLINQIPQLGAELSILENLMAGDMEKIMHQQSGYCFTTLKATYQHLISDSFLSSAK